MPVVSITLLPGYDPDTQHRMVNHVANAVRSVIATPEAGTTVFINEVSTYRRDGKVFSGGRAPHPVASDLVNEFLLFTYQFRGSHAPFQCKGTFQFAFGIFYF